MQWIYDNPTYKDRDDCSIRAFAKLLDKPYVDVKEDLLKLKRLNKETRYYTMRNIERYIKMNNLKEIKVKKVLTIWTLLTKNPKGKYLIYIDGHLTTGIDGKLYDSWDSSKQRIVRLWTI